jgi:hypothetical protein
MLNRPNDSHPDTGELQIFFLRCASVDKKISGKKLVVLKGYSAFPAGNTWTNSGLSEQELDIAFVVYHI